MVVVTLVVVSVVSPVDAGPDTGDHAASLRRHLRPHGYFDFTQFQRGELGWAPMNYETVVHSPVPLRDKIAAIVEYKIPVEKASGTSAVAWGAHGYGRYNSTAAPHLGMVCLGVFGLDGEVIAIHDIKFKSPSKMRIALIGGKFRGQIFMNGMGQITCLNLMKLVW